MVPYFFRNPFSLFSFFFSAAFFKNTHRLLFLFSFFFFLSLPIQASPPGPVAPRPSSPKRYVPSSSSSFQRGRCFFPSSSHSGDATTAVEPRRGERRAPSF